MAHLTDEIYRRLLSGDLPPADAREVATHLDAGCEPCEAFLADRSPADALDGRVDAALAAAAPPAAAPGDDLEFARIRRQLGGDALAARRARPGRRAILALAAAVLVAGVAGVVLRVERTRRPAWDGEKGFGSAARAIPLRLRFLVLSEARGPAPSIEKGVPGQVVPPTASLQFEVEVGRAARVALVHVPPHGAPEVFFDEALPAGRTAVTVSGRPAVFPLDGLAGEQRFLAVASDGRIGEARLSGVARALAGEAPAMATARDGGDLDGVSAVVTVVTVR